MKLYRHWAGPAMWMILLLPGMAGSVSAAEQAAPDTDAQASRSNAGDLVDNYPAAFFDQYQPATALDMVKQVPGFQPDDGASLRGFGGAAGNILINGRRPSAKQDKPTSILGRIPASGVKRIELIRGKVRNINLLGYSAVVNVILSSEAPATVRWESSVEQSTHHTAPRLSLSLTDHWKNIDYNAGLNVHSHIDNYSDPGREKVYDGSGNLTERRVYQDDTHQVEGDHIIGNLNASTLLGGNHIRMNGSYGYKRHDDKLTVDKNPVDPAAGPDSSVYRHKIRNTQLELGMDVERKLRTDLSGRAIFLYAYGTADPFESERDLDASGNTTKYKRAATTSNTTEAIGRFEFNWSGWDGHSVQFNVEADYNVLDSSLLQTVDTGGGPVVVDVPNGNVRVEEKRGDVLLQDTWTLGNFELEYGIGAQTSTLSESGDTHLTRHFFFPKPHMVLTWSPSPEQQTQLRIERQVSQLNFSDFASATVFTDNDLALGNPNLRPDTTWAAQLSQEWRFGQVGVIKLTAFNDWISDVLDLLPVSATDEVPGNIGSGRRWGVQMEGTLPLEWLRLHGAKLDVKARWQDSRVTDPVTGKPRVLSAVKGVDPHVVFGNDNEWIFDVLFRQDFNAARWAWGWELAEQADRPVYKVNELQVYHEGLHFNAFVETTRWLGVKLRLDALNILNYLESRDRTVYVGERGLTPVGYREVKRLNNGAHLMLTLSGSF